MDHPPDTLQSKGLAMIAAYRAERLSRRPSLRASLRLPIPAPSRAREPAPVTAAFGNLKSPASLPEPSSLDAVETPCVFAGLIGMALAERDLKSAEAQALEDAMPAVTAAPVAAPVAAAMQAVPTTRTGPDAEAPPTADLAPAAEQPQPHPHPAVPAETVAAPTAPVFAGDAPEAQDRDAAEAAKLDIPNDPPLAEIGFGPGMLIRLSQLGLHTIGDLAQADATRLRSALGDISRLVDVETWINNARQNGT